MTKFLKWFAILIGALVLIALIAMVILMTCVSPNRFKPMIIDQVKKATGREMMMDGNLSWTFFPVLGVKAGHIQLSNPSQFKQKIFAEVEDFTVSVKLMPLLHGSVQSDGITLHGMQLNLIKNAEGKVNWIFQLPKSDQPTQTAVPTSPVTSQSNFANKFSVSTLAITDATINWLDEQTKKSATINHFELQAKDIDTLGAFPLQVAFDFNAKNPDVSGNFKLTSEIAIDLAKSTYALSHLEMAANVKQVGTAFNVKVLGDIVADLSQQTVTGSNLTTYFENLTMRGKATLKDLNTTPAIQAHFTIEPFDIKSLMQSLGKDTSNLQSAKMAQGEITISGPLTATQVKGQFNVDEIEAAKLKLTHLTTTLNFKNGLATLSPIKADLYQGTLAADVNVNVSTPTPAISAQAHLINIQAEPLLTDLRGANQKITVVGAGNVDLNVTTTGAAAPSLVKNLNGNAKISFNNGVLKGVDIGHWIDSAAAVFNKQAPAGSNTDQTSFGNLSATAVIQSGVITNHDLVLDAPRFLTKGDGTINLVTQQIDYSLQATVKDQTNAVKNFSGIIIPILISGNLNSPSIRLDMNTLLKSIAAKQMDNQKTKIREKVQQQIENKLGGQLPANAQDALKKLLGH